MIKKLRQRFILIAMFSITLVLTCLVAFINIGSYMDTMRSLDQRLTILKENGGMFPKNMEPGLKKQQPMKDIFFPLFYYTSEETPFDTRYFTVSLTHDGNVLMVNTGRIASVTTKEASRYAKYLWDKGDKEGFYEQYKYTSLENEREILYIFLNCEKEMRALQLLQLVSALVLVLGIVVVFLLVLFLTRLAIRPVEESYAKQKRFITDASHEIKTPLAIIDANTEVIEMENGESEWTLSTRKQIKRLSDLTQKLIFLSRMDEEDRKIEMHSFPLKETLEHTLENYDSLLQGKKLTMQLEDISFYGNQENLIQMIQLLMDNAIKYSDEQGNIHVNCLKKGRKTILTFSNTVDQIKQGNLDVLFERFYRTDDSRNSKTGGYGIGLSVVKAIVEAHNGKISCESADGKSILFTIVFG